MKSSEGAVLDRNRAVAVALAALEHVLVFSRRWKPVSLGQFMSMDSHISGGSTFQGGNSMQKGPIPQERTCAGQCGVEARAAYDAAAKAGESLGQIRIDLSKKFQFLYDVSGSDRHQEAEILREHTLALYEALYGQEDPTVAEALIELAAVYTAHGNSSSAEYMVGWAHDILNKPKDEPQHEFFHLFGYDKPDDEDERARNPS